MELVVVTADGRPNSKEAAQINELFQAGLKYLHLRKPDWPEGELEDLILSIAPEFWPRLSLHAHHDLALKYPLGGIHLPEAVRREELRSWLLTARLKLKRPELRITTSYHNLKDLERGALQFDYIFLSPIFESISKPGYHGVFTLAELKPALSEINNVIALGGIDLNRLSTLSELGFFGAALRGAIWNSADPVSAFREIQACQLAKAA